MRCSPSTRRPPQRSRSPSRPSAVPLIGSGYRVYVINPRAAARYRERHQVGGGKSDRGDARMLANLVRTDRHNPREVAGDSALDLHVPYCELPLGGQPVGVSGVTW